MHESEDEHFVLERTQFCRNPFWLHKEHIGLNSNLLSTHRISDTLPANDTLESKNYNSVLNTQPYLPVQILFWRDMLDHLATANEIVARNELVPKHISAV